MCKTHTESDKNNEINASICVVINCFTIKSADKIGKCANYQVKMKNSHYIFHDYIIVCEKKKNLKIFTKMVAPSTRYIFLYLPMKPKMWSLRSQRLQIL